VAHYLAQPDTTVLGAVRDASSLNATELDELPKGEGSRLIVVSLSANNPMDATEAMLEIQMQHLIGHIDIAVANAGICDHYGPVEEMTDSDVLSHFEVNALGPLRLFRAISPLLRKASVPKFAYISTALASIHMIEQVPSLTTAYGMSKVAGNYLVKKIDAENKEFIALLIDPGYVLYSHFSGDKNSNDEILGSQWIEWYKRTWAVVRRKPMG
jgi:norsolorinic acid ketoreductase